MYINHTTCKLHLAFFSGNVKRKERHLHIWSVRIFQITASQHLPHLKANDIYVPTRKDKCRTFDWFAFNNYAITSSFNRSFDENLDWYERFLYNRLDVLAESMFSKYFKYGAQRELKYSYSELVAYLASTKK